MVMGRDLDVTKWGNRTLWVAMPLLVAASYHETPRRAQADVVGLACGIGALGLMERRYRVEADAVTEGMCDELQRSAAR